ncbi:hypothetical protein EVAR_75485_1 [Eumeta japonica]|uniref:Uncharacterized protein n=1 Tax=Eumeta variegata TaxID=151549 RepID=A0A4C1TMM9_EUMVA|nr:hypothetical protein EVAR_75485_1 [Eumeta japonica]
MCIRLINLIHFNAIRRSFALNSISSFGGGAGVAQRAAPDDKKTKTRDNYVLPLGAATAAFAAPFCRAGLRF